MIHEPKQTHEMLQVISVVFCIDVHEFYPQNTAEKVLQFAVLLV
jgi:hypothetical protein